MKQLQLLPLAAALLVAGCTHLVRTPAPSSPAPVARLDELRAGLARAEITPPMGAGLFGYGPEGKLPDGFRHRLYARALVLEDTRGERLALVVADLGAVSALLHRAVAARLQPPGADAAGAATASARAASAARPDSVRIGADRLIIAATHTHSAPGNFLGMAYDEFGSQPEAAGHDTVLLGFLADRIAGAVRQALADLQPARIAWGTAPVWGLTRNRALRPWSANRPRWVSPFTPPAGLTDAQRAVDPQWAMLRVDQADLAGTYRPAGAFSIFAIHGTALPSANTLYDGDVHAILARRLERHIDSLNQRLPGPRPHAVHLVGNGSEGDVSPDVSPQTRCPAPRLRSRLLLYPALFSSSSSYWVAPDPEVTDRCLALARAEVQRVGDAIAEHAIRLFDSLRPSGGVVSIARAFRVHTLHGAAADLPGVCREARVGIAGPSGVADGKTRYAGYAGIREGNRNLRSTDCHSPKIPFLGDAQRAIVDEAGYPRTAQLSAFRIGAMTVATVPGEITTTAGGRVQEAVARAARLHGFRGDSVALLALTNGYMQYTVTPEEYNEQQYEGASTLYGPGQADALARALADLTVSLGRAGAPSPAVEVPPERVRVFRYRVLTPRADDGPPAVTRAVAEHSCRAADLRVRWYDLAPGRMVRDTTVWFEIRRGPGGELVAWDDRNDVDVRLEPRTRRERARGAWWNLHWLGARAGETYTITFRPASSSPTTVEVACGS